MTRSWSGAAPRATFFARTSAPLTQTLMASSEPRESSMRRAVGAAISRRKYMAATWGVDSCTWPSTSSGASVYSAGAAPAGAPGSGAKARAKSEPGPSAPGR